MKKITITVLFISALLGSCKKKDESPSPSTTGSCLLTSANYTIVSPSTNQTYTGHGELTYDMSGRITQSKSTGDAPNTYDLSNYTYDSQDRLVESKSMYFDGSQETWSSTHRYKYDGSGKIAEMIRLDESGNYDSTVYQYVSSTKAIGVDYSVHNVYTKDTVTTIYEADANGNLIKRFSNSSTKHFDKDSFLLEEEYTYYPNLAPTNYSFMFADDHIFESKQLLKSEISYGYDVYNTTVTQTNTLTGSYTYKFDTAGKLIQEIYDGTKADDGNIETTDFVYTCK